MKNDKMDLDSVRIEKCADYFRTLSHPVRLKIIDLLAKGPRCVGDLQKMLKIAQPPTSHHLKLLCKIGVLNYKRSGKKTFYSLKAGIINKTVRLVNLLSK